MTTASVPTEQDFDWLCAEMLGFIRTQLIAAAATLRLPEQLQDGGQWAGDFAAANGLEPEIAFRFLRACTKTGPVTCKDGSIFRSTARLRGLHGGTPGNLRQPLASWSFEAYLPEAGEDVPPTMSDTQVPLIDLHMMVANDGQERSLGESDALFEQALLRRVRTKPLDNGYVVIETVAA
jgi:hypothetical protein